MKKKLLLVLLALMPMIVSAEEVEIDGLWYNLISKGQVAEVIQYKNNIYYSGDIEIPAKITLESVEYSVVAIGEGAFNGCDNLTSIIIPNTVTSINYKAFYGCGRITSIIIPNSVTYIGSFAFGNCISLSTVFMPSSVTTIDGSAFYKCENLTSLHITDLASWCNITFVTSKSNPLYYARHLYLNGEEVNDLIIPYNVYGIGNYAFGYFSGLTSVTISDNVTNIGDCAFSGCKGLTSVVISNSVTTIGKSVFSGCSSLTSLTMGNKVTTIGENAFSGCSSLSSLVLPNNLSTIEKSAFAGCSSLTSLTMGNKVTTIGENAFSGCSSLSSLVIPNSVKTIGAKAFFGGASLTSLIIGNYIRNINSQAFADCEKLTEVFCYAETVPSTYSDAFNNSYIEYATLHVPAASLEAYKAATPWSGFKNIVPIDGETPIVEKCATPTITYANGKVRFACETEGVEYVPTVTCSPNQLQNGNELAIGGTFTVSVYAVKEGYENSDTATMTINMSQMGDLNADGQISIADVTSLVNVILGK